MAYSIYGGKGKGATRVNPVVSLSGLKLYIDPLNSRSYHISANTFANLFDSENLYETLVPSISSEKNNRFKYFNFNDLRNLAGTFTTELSTCCIQLWVRRNQEIVVPTDNFISVAATTLDRPTEHWLHNLTITTELTSITYSNFLNNSLIGTTLPNKATRVGNSFRLTLNEAYHHGHVYLNTPLQLKDKRENNMNWEVYYEFSYGSPDDISSGISIIFNSVLGQIGLSDTFTGYNTIPNSFAIHYRNSGRGPVTNSVSIAIQGFLAITPLIATANPSFSMKGSTPTEKTIYNWVQYNKSTQQLLVFVSETNTKPVSPLITVDNFDPFTYLLPTFPPYLSDIIVSKTNSVSTYGVYYNKLGKLGFSVGEDNITTAIDSLSSEWELITLNFEPESVRLFKNLIYFQSEKPKNFFKTNFLTIGNTNNIDIGQILFYDRHLTESEIFENYRNFLNRYNIPADKIQTNFSIIPLELETIDYVNRAGITDFRVVNQINTFIIGLKSFGLFDRVNCWPLIQGQNSSVGETLYSFGSAFNNVPATIIGTYNRTISGISLNSNSYIDTNTEGILGNNDRAIMMVINNNNSPGFLGGWGQSGAVSIDLPGYNWSIKKPNGISVFQEFYFYSLDSIESNRGVGISYGEGKGTTWSPSDIAIENVNGVVDTRSGNFYINRGYAYNGEKNNETYSFVLRSDKNFTETDFYNVYELYKNTLGKKLALPEANIPIDFDPDTIAYLTRVSEQKSYFYKKALNDFIKFLKNNNLWNDVVVFPLGTNVNKTTGKLQSFGNYTQGVNYEGEVLGSGFSRGQEGILLTSTSYVSTNVPSTTGSEDRSFLLISNGSGVNGFVVGEGINNINKSFNLKKTGSNVIIDCWFNSSNSFPISKGIFVNVENNKFSTINIPSNDTPFYGYIDNLDTAPGNVLINQGNEGYTSERSLDTYYFLLKAKKSINLADGGLIYSTYKNTIGINNNNLEFSNIVRTVPSSVIEYCQLSGNYVSFSNLNRFKDFKNKLDISNSTSTSPLFNLNLFDKMACWPLRQGQNAGSQTTQRNTSPTVYSFGGLPQASAVRIGPVEENSSGVVSSSTNDAASGRIITTGRKLSNYSERTLYAAANISSYFNFGFPNARRARLMYSTFAEPTFVNFAGSDANGIILEGYGHGSQIANTTSATLIGNVAIANPVSKPTFNTFNTFSSIYSLSSISHVRNNVLLVSADYTQNQSLPNTPGWASALTDARNLTILNSEDEPLPYGGSVIGTVAFAADFEIGLTVEQLSAFDVIYKSTLGEGIAFQ